MNIDLNDAIVRLSPDNNFQMRDARGACVHVHWGDLWITQEGDRKDHIVKSGESFAISQSGMTLLAAISEAGVSVMEKCRESAIATTAYIGSVVGPAASEVKEAEARRIDDSVDKSGPVKSRLTNELPGLDALDHYVARGERLRARFFGDTISRAWNTLRRSMGVMRELG